MSTHRRVLQADSAWISNCCILPMYTVHVQTHTCSRHNTQPAEQCECLRSLVVDTVFRKAGLSRPMSSENARTRRLLCLFEAVCKYSDPQTTSRRAAERKDPSSNLSAATCSRHGSKDHASYTSYEPDQSPHSVCPIAVGSSRQLGPCRDAWVACSCPLQSGSDVFPAEKAKIDP